VRVLPHAGRPQRRGLLWSRPLPPCLAVPSAEVREGFETYQALTEDGRIVTGFLVDRDNQVVVLRGADGQNVTLAQAEIEELLPQRKSLMPEGVLRELNDQQIRDLFAYLRSTQPLSD